MATLRLLGENVKEMPIAGNVSNKINLRNLENNTTMMNVIYNKLTIIIFKCQICILRGFPLKVLLSSYSNSRYFYKHTYTKYEFYILISISEVLKNSTVIVLLVLGYLSLLVYITAAYSCYCLHAEFIVSNSSYKNIFS